MATAEKSRGTAGGTEALWPKWITYDRAQELYGLSKWSWLRLCRAGEITCCFVGSRRLMSVESIERFLDERAEAHVEADTDATEADS